MKIQHFENNPEIQFDIDLIARIVHAINKAVTVNILLECQVYRFFAGYAKFLRPSASADRIG